MTALHTDDLLRADRDIIASLVPTGARVLDLGCGDGALLAELIRRKQVRGCGVEINEEYIIRAMERGLSICQGDIDHGLADYPDRSFDYVILNQTLQVITRPALVLREMLRVGKHGIVGFPNFGHWRVRAALSLTGKMPKTPSLPFEWYDTPNIHLHTIRDFRNFCRAENIAMVREEYFLLGKWRCSPLANPLANLYAITGMFVISGNAKP
jgi:methionine biosynthesis protein MetW